MIDTPLANHAKYPTLNNILFLIKPRRGVVSIRLFENHAVCPCRPSVRLSVCPSVRLSVCPSVCPSVRPRTISSEPTERISTKLGMQDVHDPVMVLGPKNSKFVKA